MSPLELLFCHDFSPSQGQQKRFSATSLSLHGGQHLIRSPESLQLAWGANQGGSDHRNSSRNLFFRDRVVGKISRPPDVIGQSVNAIDGFDKQHIYTWTVITNATISSNTFTFGKYKCTQCFHLHPHFSVFFPQFVRNDVALNFRGAFINFCNAGITEVAFDWIVFHIAEATVNLHGHIGDFVVHF